MSCDAFIFISLFNKCLIIQSHNIQQCFSENFSFELLVALMVFKAFQRKFLSKSSLANGKLNFSSFSSHKFCHRMFEQRPRAFIWGNLLNLPIIIFNALLPPYSFFRKFQKKIKLKKVTKCKKKKIHCNNYFYATWRECGNVFVFYSNCQF